MCGKPIRVNKYLIGTKGGFPLKFYYLKPLIDSGNVEQIKFVLTLLNISRTITPRKGENIPVSLKSIVDPNTKSYKTINGGFILDFIKDFNLTFKFPQYSTSDFFISLKIGPHGPSILSIMETIKWLNAKQLFYISTIIDSDFFKDYIGSFYSYMKHMNLTIPDGTEHHRNFTFDKYSKNLDTRRSTGRLALISDPECKQRIIAISDYITQFTLKPIHKILMDNLSKIPCDRTYTQDPFHK